MTELLEQALGAASRLPAEEQDLLASRLPAELAADDAFDERIVSSASLAESTIKERREGSTHRLDPKAV